MAELANCLNCDAVFVKNTRNICQKCFQEEEAAFDTVYRFLTKQKNREATLMQIVEATRVEEKVIIKFIKENRLRATQFPNLAYPCEKCGDDIASGKICTNCSREIISELEKQEKIDNLEKRDKSEGNVYYSYDKYKN